jgi:uncharacterized protein YbjT (DUF2867 family)
MSEQPSILVFGATGLTGLETVRLLSKAGFLVRASYQSSTDLQMLSSHAISHPIQADFGDADSLMRAMEGITKLVSITPIDERAPQWHETILKCAKESGINHFIRLSQIGSHAKCMSPIGAGHFEADEALKSSGVAYTIVKPASYYQNLFWSSLTIIRANVFALPLGEISIAMVDSRDVSRVLAHTTVDEGHEGQEYVVTGPRPMTMHMVARRLGRSIGKDIRYRPIPAAGAERSFRDAGIPAWQALATVEMFSEYASGEYNYATSHYKAITNKDPTTFEQFATHYASYFLRENAGLSG